MSDERNDARKFEEGVQHLFRLMKQADADKRAKERLDKRTEENLSKVEGELGAQARLQIGLMSIMQHYEEERMQELLSNLDEETAQEVTDLLAAADRVANSHLDQVFREGAEMHAVEEGIPGGLIEYARELLQEDDD